MLKNMLALWILCIFSRAQADLTYRESFAAKKNPSKWSFGRPLQFGEKEAGDYFIFTDDLSDFSPALMTNSKTSRFSGNILKSHVKQISIDIKIEETEYPVSDRPFAIEFVSDNGTPENIDDDWAIFALSAYSLPTPEDGWKTYTFDIPASAEEFSAGWEYLPFGENSPSTPNWKLIRENVSQTGFRFGDPKLAYILMSWKIAADNLTIVTE